MAERSVVIIGAGVSGLAAAFRLKQRRPDWDIRVIDKSDRPGGNVGTLAIDGYRVEAGPNGFLDSKPTTLELCRDLGLGDRLIAASEASRKNRYVFLDGKLRRLPGTAWSLFTTPLMNLWGKYKFLTESRRRSRPPAGDESVHDFAVRRAGRQVAEVFADALVTGIHGGDPKLLSAAACFPRLPKFEAEFGSVVRGFAANAQKRRADAAARGEEPQPQRMWSFREGLQVLIDELANRVAPIHTGEAVSRVERADGRWRVTTDAGGAWRADDVILTTPAYIQSQQLADLDRELSQKLAEIQYNKIAVVAVGFRESDVTTDIDGFGYIAPQRTGRDVLGVQWCSSIFPGRAPDGHVLWRALCGGWHRADVLDWDDGRLIRAVRDELRLATGVKAEPTFTHVIRWPRAIPQYFVGHPQRVAAVRSLAAKHPGLHLAGNAFDGVALNDCCGQAEALAGRVGGH